MFVTDLWGQALDISVLVYIGVMPTFYRYFFSRKVVSLQLGRMSRQAQGLAFILIVGFSCLSTASGGMLCIELVARVICATIASFHYWTLTVYIALLLCLFLCTKRQTSCTVATQSYLLVWEKLALSIFLFPWNMYHMLSSCTILQHWMF